LIPLIANSLATKRFSIEKITAVHISNQFGQPAAGKISAKKENDVFRRYAAQGGDVD
jgi:hypothetical protein